MWFATILVVALVGSGRLHGASAKESCQLTLQTDLDPSKEPLVLQVSETQIRSQVETLEIPWPKVVNGKGVITVNDGDELLLACLGKKNDVSGNNKKSTYIRCDNGKLMEGNKKATKETNSCTRIYSESFLKVTDERCGSGDNTGTVLELGFELNEKSWFPLVDVCHNIDSAVSYYASHELYGHSLRGAVKSSERRKFSRGPKSVFPTVNPDSVYTRKGQEKAFDRILGAGGSNMYINNTFFLSRGHLAPDADFIYNSGQLLTYYYVNVAPQWQPFNAGNWLSIESTVRNLAIKYEKGVSDKKAEIMSNLS